MWHHSDVTMSDGVPNHQCPDCLFNRLFGRRSNKSSKLRVTALVVRRIHRWPVDSPHKGLVTRKMFLFYDVMVTLTWTFNEPISSWSHLNGNLLWAADSTLHGDEWIAMKWLSLSRVSAMCIMRTENCRFLTFHGMFKTHWQGFSCIII